MWVALLAMLLAFSVIISLGKVVITSLLIHGARLAKPSLLNPWLIITLVSMVFDTICLAIAVPTSTIDAVFWLVTKILVNAYGLLCVYSFKKQLEGEFMRSSGPILQDTK